VEKKLTKVLLGFPFFILKHYTETIDDNSLIENHILNPNSYFEYQSEKVKLKLTEMFRRKQIFNSWRQTAISKRVDFPYSYNSNRLIEKAFKGFKF